MKKLLLLALATVVVGGGATLAVRHYNKYQNNEQAQTQAAVSAQADKVADLEAEVNKVRSELVTEVTRLRGECEKGRAAYDQLTTFAKSKVAVPQCTPATVQ